VTQPDTEALRELAAVKTEASRQLDDQARRAAQLQAYYDGDQDVLALMDTEERRAFRRFLRESGANWLSLVVNAVAERLQVTAFRFEGAEEDAWRIWQASQMDADAELVQTDALVTGSSFVLVQPDDDNPTGVSITPESPLETTVLYENGNRRRRYAGYKRYGDNGGRTEILILPDLIATWETRGRGPFIEPNPSGVVGLIEIVPQPRTLGPPRSELSPALATADRINTTLFNRLVATDYGAFRQIWATGVKIAREVTRDRDGNETGTRPVRPYDIGANRLLANENPDGRFGSFPESTLAGYLAAVEQDVQQLAAITQTPPHYLLGSMVNLSADAIKAAEAGLVAKVRRRSLHIGEGWEEVMRTALALTGNPAAADVGAEVVWADFETRSEAQLVDALVKMAGLGVPTEVLWERWGASPQEVRRWQQLAAEEEAATAASAAAAMAAAPEQAYNRLLTAAQTAPPGPATPGAAP
jgi:hypothetical protein